MKIAFFGSSIVSAYWNGGGDLPAAAVPAPRFLMGVPAGAISRGVPTSGTKGTCTQRSTIASTVGQKKVEDLEVEHG